MRKYGKDRVVQIVTFGTLAARGVIRDVGRVMDMPYAFVDSIAKMGAKKVVYVSCNPETLARDLAYMKKLGYKAKEAVGFDMFPATEHVETVVLMSRVSK